MKIIVIDNECIINFANIATIEIDDYVVNDKTEYKIFAKLINNRKIELKRCSSLEKAIHYLQNIIINIQKTDYIQLSLNG